MRTVPVSKQHKFRKISVLAAIAVPVAVLMWGAAPAFADPSLASSANFAVLGASAVTNTGATTISGFIGVAPGTSFTGSGTVTGGVVQSTIVSQTAQNDASTAYNATYSLTPTLDLSGQDLGGLTLTPGVYKFDSSAQLTGNLILNFTSDPTGSFIFEIGSTLTTASASSVTVEDGSADSTIIWDVGSSATLGITTALEGSILAIDSVTLTTGASVTCGRAIAMSGAVTMDTNTVSTVCSGSNTPIPEPSSMLVLAVGLASAAAVRWASLRRS